MRKKVLEGSVLFISISKWIFLASLTGIIGGFSTAFFLKLLGLSMDFAKGYKYYFILLPAAMFLSVIIVKYLAPEAEGHGTEKVIEAVHKRSGKINPLVVPVKLLATIITIASGGFAGIVGYHVSSYLGITYFHHSLNFVPVFSSFFFIKVCFGGMFFGLCSFLFVELLNYFKKINHKIKMPMPFKGVLAGMALMGLAFLVS